MPSAAAATLCGVIFSVSTAQVGVYLGVYATTVSTLAGLWAVYAGLFRDRARIRVRAHEAFLVNSTKGKMIVRGEDTLHELDVKPNQRVPILEIVITNRGRRNAKIKKINQRRRWHGSLEFGDLAGQVPFDLPADDSHVVVLGARGGYAHGTISTRGFFATDGAERIHPLRTRWSRRLTFSLYGWAIHLYFKRYRRALRATEHSSRST